MGRRCSGAVSAGPKLEETLRVKTAGDPMYSFLREQHSAAARAYAEQVELLRAARGAQGSTRARVPAPAPAPVAAAEPEPRQLPAKQPKSPARWARQALPTRNRPWE